MADARSNSQTRYLLAGVPEVSTQGRRAVHAIRGAEGSRLRRTDYPEFGRRRRCRRSHRPKRPARSDNHTNCAAPRLFLPLAILIVRTIAAMDRDLPDAHRPGRRHRTYLRGALHLPHWREELASTTFLSRDRDSDRYDHRHAHLARYIFALVTGDGRVERRTYAH